VGGPLDRFSFALDHRRSGSHRPERQLSLLSLDEPLPSPFNRLAADSSHPIGPDDVSGAGFAAARRGRDVRLAAAGLAAARRRVAGLRVADFLVARRALAAGLREAVFFAGALRAAVLPRTLVRAAVRFLAVVRFAVERFAVVRFVLVERFGAARFVAARFVVARFVVVRFALARRAVLAAGFFVVLFAAVFRLVAVLLRAPRVACFAMASVLLCEPHAPLL
jgi:hypothetical protein